MTPVRPLPNPTHRGFSASRRILCNLFWILSWFRFFVEDALVPGDD